ncbi:hypothetical protein FOH24_13000 [Acetobacter tropicalis]|uniref:DUF6874 domain-containing protein n=1 Tax=Acetobacter tropicalis TaxID=104102 RepID=A0A094YSD7_9PROT|nr:hypothetical protein [Acetobacter tropicalis]KAA8387894.1 hypothetical protein FOH24_13000 [Acetobacter tropicalis]KAA8388807.1 hypothetical protein FOH22_08310 [Acetobacter tropicalis]KGB24292.1 hypothetical protein AtDm6_1290 [Acetobacter tropicalis]MDO8172353.1 hypothetical protein [Acetobacter tropicalis]
MTVKFDATDAEAAAVRKIAKRYAHLARTYGDTRKYRAIKLHATMDLLAVNANGCPLDFMRMQDADDFNLLHDVCGIDRHLDRDSGKLLDCFVPRFAKQEMVA